jgi:predicted Zn-dependent protease
VATLIAKAESEFNAGRLDRSAANLERAIRIEPRNPVLWHNLATIRLQQGRYAQAESMAGKSNSLIAPGAALVRKNWKIIAEARRLMGDTEGAHKAQTHAQ